jgi:hypothetical protein
MNNTRKILSLLALFLIVGGAVTSFFVLRNKAKAPDTANNQVNATPTPSSVSTTRRNPTCNDFASNLVSGTGKQPSNFPQPFGNTTVCGTSTELNETYYIFYVDQDRLFDYYGNALKALNYTVNPPAKGKEEGDFKMEFSNTNGDSGYVYWYGDKAAYAINYNAK